MTRVDHETVGEFHGFGTSGPEFSRYHNLTTLCTRLHDESKNTIASTIIRKEDGEWVYRRTAKPAKSLYLKLSH